MHKYWEWSFALLLISHCIHVNIQALLLIPLCVTTSLCIKDDFRFYTTKFNKPLILLFSTLFLLMVVGLFRSFDLEDGVTRVSRNLSFIVMPFFTLPLIKSSSMSRKRFLFVFQAAILFSGIAFLLFATYNFWTTGSVSSIPGDSHFSYNFYMSHLLTNPFGVHPIYHSLVVTMGSVSLISYAASAWNCMWNSRKILVLLLLAFHFILIVLLKSAVFSLLYAFSMAVVLFYFGYKSALKSIKVTLLATLTLILICGIAGKSLITKLESFEVEYNLSDQHQSALQARLGLWDCATPLFIGNWLTGVGTGNLQHFLNEEYKARNFKFVLVSGEEYNPHNQFLQYGITYGILAPLVLLCLLILILAQSIKQKNTVALLFSLCFLAFCLTESTLQTQRGILIFTCFAGIFFNAPNFWKFGIDEDSGNN